MEYVQGKFHSTAYLIGNKYKTIKETVSLRFI